MANTQDMIRALITKDAIDFEAIDKGLKEECGVFKTIEKNLLTIAHKNSGTNEILEDFIDRNTVNKF